MTPTEIKPVKESTTFVYLMETIDTEVRLEIDYKRKLYTVSLWDNSTSTDVPYSELFVSVPSNELIVNVLISETILEAIRFAVLQLSN